MRGFYCLFLSGLLSAGCGAGCGHKLLTVSPHASQMTVIGVHNYLVLFNLIFQSTGNVFYSHA